MMIRSIICTLAALCIGCAGMEEEPPLVGELVAGSAEYDGSGFVAVEDGSEVELIPGAQGGFHVWLNVRVQGVAGELYLEREARRVSDEQLVFRGIPQYVDIPEDAMNQWWDGDAATPAFMCPTPIGIKVYDEELIFNVWLTDGDGEILAADELSLIPRCPSGDQAEFCREICSG